MITLFISTYNQFVIISLIKNNNILKEKTIKSDKTHSTNLVPTINNILNESNINIKELEEIIVVNGPGSFTGVRLGVTVAKTLAYTLNINIKTISSIDAIALSNDINKSIIQIPDSKGYYYKIINNNDIANNINYLNNKEFEKLLTNYQDYKIIDNQNINILKVYLYLKNKESINPHKVNPLYIKKIELLNGR